MFQVIDTSNGIKVYTTHNVTQQSLLLGLRSTRSKIEIVANQSFFVLGQMSLKCEARIYLLWTGVAHKHIRDETPLLAPVLGSTSSHSVVEDSTFGTLHNLTEM